MTTLNLGCGADIIDGAVNTDIAPGPGIDVVWDLDRHPWPWPDRSFDTVLAYDVWEHVDNPIGFMAEAHRVLSVGGLLGIRTCSLRDEGGAVADAGFRDPTHRRWATRDTFHYWVPGTFWWEKYGDAYAAGKTIRFAERSWRLAIDNVETVLEKL